MNTKHHAVAIQKRNVSKRLSMWAMLVASILMIPLLGQFPWTLSDYVFAGVVLFGSATAYELITKNMRNEMHRLVVGFIILTFIFLIWGFAVA